MTLHSHCVMEQKDGKHLRMCLMCGISEPMPIPPTGISISDYVALINSFIDKHKDCKNGL